MKTNRIFLMLIAFVAISITFVQCNKDKVIVSELTGKVTYESGMAADGAIVSVSTEANASNVVMKTIAAADGTYKFAGIEDGTYYVSAKFNTENTNNKSVGFVFVTDAEAEVTVEGADVSKDLSLVGTASTGNGSVDLADGWAFDNTHSTIAFEFPYDANNAPFTGIFGEAGFVNDVFKFDETAPTATTFEAWVYLPSVETGSPTPAYGHGRDDINGCIMGTFGVERDNTDVLYTVTDDQGNITSYFYNETAAQTDDYSGTGYAHLKTKSVSVYGDGYKAVCDFTFHGFTHEVDMYFHYVEGYVKDDGTIVYSSFNGWFEFAALADYEIESGHVGDSDVKVNLAIQFKKTL